ncbi:MAG: ABC transporter ATP-binding protein [Cyanobacteria bacterium P01_G01_bin.19]
MLSNLSTITGDRQSQLNRGTILYSLSAFCGTVPFVFLYFLIQSLFNQTLNFQTALINIAGISVSLLLQGILLLWANHLTYVTTYRMSGDLRLRLGDRLRQLPLGFFKDKQVGDINTLITDDITKIEQVPSWVYPKIVSAIVTPSSIAIFLLFIDWRMGLATLAGVPVAVAIYFGSQKTQAQIAQQQKQSIVETNARIIEYVQGLETIKAFNQVGTRYQKLHRAIENYRDVNLQMVTKLTTPILAFSAVLDLGFAVIVAAGIYLMAGGTLTVPIFLLFLILGLRLYRPLHQLVEFSTLTRMMDIALERVQGVFNSKTFDEPVEATKLSNFDIEFKNVHFSYDRQPVLNNISFKVPQRSITALVGASGAGKTTITNLIARFWDVDSGEILVGGINIKDLPTTELLANISMVFQDVYLFNDTIANNIKFGNPNATEEQVIAAAKKAQCHDFIQQLVDGYNTVIGEGGTSLSGGEKQRLAIARAMLKDAPIVLLDEATASLDPENELLIQQAIDRLVESKTLIIIAHRLSTIRNAAQILVMDSGYLVERGTHQELLAQQGTYYRLWRSRQQAQSWQIK